MRELFAGHDPAAPALVDADAGAAVSYGELAERVGRAAALLSRELGRGLAFLVATPTPGSIALYLACLEARCPVALLEPGPAERLAPLLQAYAPDALLLPADAPLPAGYRPGAPLPEPGYQLAVPETTPPARVLHPALALLLTTSGSTGSPKLVRLSRENLLANARSIARYLALGPGERSIQSLPMQYSYGLSLVNSHLAAGGSVALTAHSFLRPEFWAAFDRARCTSFAGVPYVYETLHRLRFDPAKHPTLRTLTQAGGGLRRDLAQAFSERARAAGARLFVMYGQTEATARIAYVPPERLPEKLGSIGVPIPDGALALAPVEDSEREELVYRGPNVMLGYAESAAGLAAGDELQGTLRTGDLASVDEDGFYFLTGRLNRIAKLFGRRISLEDVERDLERTFAAQVAATEREGGLLIHAAAPAALDLPALARHLAQALAVPPQSIRVVQVPELPRTASGKKDYGALAS